MTDDQARELWSQALRGGPLAPAQEQDLLSLLASNPALRDELVADLQLHRFLRGLGRGERDAEAFGRAFDQGLTAQGDATRFLKKVDTRIDGELSGMPSRDATSRRRRVGRRWTGTGGGPRGVWAVVLLAACALFGFVLLVGYSLSGSPSSSPGTARAKAGPARRTPEPDAPDLLEARRKRSEAEQARREAEERLAGLREQEKQAEEARRAAAASQERDLREKAEAAFAEIHRKLKQEEERLARLREEERKPTEDARPEPALQDKPVPVPATEAAVAKVENAVDAVAVAPGGKQPLRAGEDVRAGGAIELGDKGAVVLAYPDGTRLELGPSTEARDFAIEGGKRLFLARGTVRAVVARQPKDRPMLFGTPHGEATVLGTTLRILVDPTTTRLEVEEGRVRLTDRQKRSADVSAGHFAVAAAGPEPVARRLPVVHLADTFDEPAAVAKRWNGIVGGSPTSIAQRILDVDLSPRPPAEYGFGGWHTPGGLRTRRAYDVPLRVSADVELTAAPRDAEALIHLAPPSTPAEPADRIYSGKNVLHAVRRQDELSLMVENRPLMSAQRPWSPGRAERWVLEIDRSSVRWVVDGKEVGERSHGLRITEGFIIGLEGLGKINVPAGTRVRFDDVVIEEIAR